MQDHADVKASVVDEIIDRARIRASSLNSGRDVRPGDIRAHRGQRFHYGLDRKLGTYP